jgi:hypothetical protein
MYKLNFNYKGEKIKFQDLAVKKLAGKVVDWLFSKGYSFDNNLHKAFTKKPISLEDLKKSEVSEIYMKRIRHFHKMSNGDLLYIGGNVEPIGNYIRQMLIKFGIDPQTIKTEGFGKESSKIKKFGELDNDELDTDEDLPTSVEVDKIKIFKPNPFRQSICVLGESGAGKSYTIENILESSNHNYQFIIPTAATTGLLAQYSPSKSAYVPSRLGKMLIEASNNPSELYTAVFDECHKSNVIEMINDELLQAISLKRNRYRFISLDDDTAEVFEDSNLEVERGNIKIPDNFGFIFISSNPRVIGGNPDFFNRVDLIELTEADRKINNIEGLLSKKVEESSDKRELIDKLRSK